MRHRVARPAGDGHPVLCFLHGYDEAAPNAGDGGYIRHGPLRPGNPSLVLERFIVLVPQLPVAGDLWHRHASDVAGLVDGVLADGGDPLRVYLSGFSFGANGVFDLAALQPARWAALWAVDPTRVPPKSLLQPACVCFGDVARTRKGAFVKALGLEPGLDGARACRDGGENHVGASASAFRDAQLYEWLLRWRR
jgi:hypothetical protein